MMISSVTYGGGTWSGLPSSKVTTALACTSTPGMSPMWKKGVANISSRSGVTAPTKTMRPSIHSRGAVRSST